MLKIKLETTQSSQCNTNFVKKKNLWYQFIQLGRVKNCECISAAVKIGAMERQQQDSPPKMTWYLQLIQPAQVVQLVQVGKSIFTIATWFAFSPSAVLKF